MRRWLFLALCATIAACAGRANSPRRGIATAAPAASAGEFARLSGWTGDRQSEIIPLLLAECPRLAPVYRAACAEAPRVPPGDDAAARAFLEWGFRPERVGTALFTGYFELEIPGSRTQGGPYQIPLLRPPADPQRYDRNQIAAGALAGRGLELAWVTSAADLYFAQLQGSARLRLPDGGIMRVGSAALNGIASISTAILFDNAGIPGHDLSISAIRAWSAAHPREAAGLLARDRSYVYMAERPLTATQGPIGALGVPMTPLRSVAVDPRFIPLGGLVWIDTRVSAVRRPLQRTMLAQDTGEPINGPAHVDVFFGSGADAEAVGGRQNERGEVWVLSPR